MLFLKAKDGQGNIITIGDNINVSLIGDVVGLGRTGDGNSITTVIPDLPQLLRRSNNLSDISSSASARNNLGLTNIAVQDVVNNAVLLGGVNNTLQSLTSLNNAVLGTNSSGIPLWMSSLPSSVQDSISRLGTIASGVWQGTIVSPSYGGTGINNGSKTVTLGGNLSTVGAFTLALNLTGNTSITLPTSGTLVTSVGVTGSTGLTVTGSPITTSGTINLTLGTELQGLSGLSQTGIVARTGTGTYTGRTLTAGNGLNILNENGFSGNPTFSLSNTYTTSANVTVNWWNPSVSLDELDYIINSSVTYPIFINAVKSGSNSAGNLRYWQTISGLGDNTAYNAYYSLSYYNQANGNNKVYMFIGLAQGTIAWGAPFDMQSNSILNLPTPTVSSNPATKGYVDSAISALPVSVTNVSGTSGQIASSGGRTPALSLVPTSVTPGSYTYGGFTVDAYGRLTAASSGTPPVTSVTGSANQIVNSGTTTSPVLAFSNNPILPGNSSLTLPIGTTAQRPATGSFGMIRANSTTNLYEVFSGSAWNTLNTSNATVSSVGITAGTGINVSGSPVTSSGTITVGLGTVPIENLSGYPSSSNAFLRGDGTWTLPYINNLLINGALNLSTYGLTTSGNISATTGTLIANNLSSYNSGVIVCANALSIQDSGTYKPYNGGYGYLNSSGSVGTSSGQNPYSINCNNRVKASEFNAVSSIKTKYIEGSGETIEQEALDLFNKIPFFKYNYKDKIKNGVGVSFGVIAENLKDVLPDYVSEDDGFVPNIFQACSIKAKNQDNYERVFKRKLGDLEGDKLQLTLFDKSTEVFILEKRSKSLLIYCPQKLPNEGFAYGTFESCPSVTKNKLFELSMVVLKNALKRIELLENKLAKV